MPSRFLPFHDKSKFTFRPLQFINRINIIVLKKIMKFEKTERINIFLDVIFIIYLTSIKYKFYGFL
jgi:hypothetical protein